VPEKLGEPARTYDGYVLLQSGAPPLQVESEGSNDGELWALCKGAPEVIRNFLDQPPASYDDSYREFASQGGR